MFCDFCGKNFDDRDGFESVVHAGHHLVKCEYCNHSGAEQTYDWTTEISSRGHQMFRGQSRRLN